MADSSTPTPNITKLRKHQLAELLGVTDLTISNYVKAGMSGVTGKGYTARFNAPECLKWVQNYELQKALKSGKKPEDTDAESLNRRMLLAKTLREEYKTALIVGSVVAIADAEREINGHLELLRSKLLSLPAVWAPQVIGIKEIPEATDILSDLVDALMTELAENGEEEEVDEKLELEEDEEDGDTDSK